MHQNSNNGYSDSIIMSLILIYIFLYLLNVNVDKFSKLELNILKSRYLVKEGSLIVLISKGSV